MGCLPFNDFHGFFCLLTARFRFFQQGKAEHDRRQRVAYLVGENAYKIIFPAVDLLQLLRQVPVSLFAAAESLFNLCALN